MSNLEQPFKNKVMIVTGAAQGIGKSVARHAAQQGAKLTLVDVNKQRGEETLAEIQQLTNNAIFLALDLSQEENCKYVIEHTVSHYGHLDVLVNNVGISGGIITAHQLTAEQLRNMLAINLMIPFYLSKYAVEVMMTQNDGASIVNVSSETTLTGSQGNCAYLISKSGVNGLTKSMAADYRKYGIRVNAVCPSTTDTPMYRQALESVKKAMTQYQSQGQATEHTSAEKILAMQQYVLAPEDVAHTILFLASDAAKGISGILMPINKGASSF